MTVATIKINNRKGISAKKKSNMLFYIIVMAWPVLQFCVFYIGVNLNSILLSFQTYSYETKSYSFIGFENIIKVFQSFVNDDIIIIALKNTMIFYIVGLLCGTMLALLFSYYIFKKMFGYKFHKLLLFMPNVISPLVITIIFKYFVDRALPDLFNEVFGGNMLGLLVNGETAFETIIFYNLCNSFGVNVLMYSSAMSGISESVIESAQLDGASALREFWSIVLPMIYPTLSTFLVVGVAQLFLNQANIFNFFGESAGRDYYTIGYYLYLKTYQGVTYSSLANFPTIASYGVVLTIFAAPLTLLVRWLLTKFGPSED